MVRPKRAPNNIKKALTTGSQSTTTELNLNDEDSVVLQKKSINNKIQKIDEDNETKAKNDKLKKLKNIETINEEALKEPRKRRMASLNAEFLVHYCSNNNSNTIQTPEKRTSQSPSSSKRRRTISNDSKHKIVNTRKRKIKKKDESEENDSVSEENVKEVKKVQKKKNVRTKSKVANVESDSENSENSEDKAQTRSRRHKKSDENLAASIGRPKREASMRASAMIIQTNEIEKTRFQYYSSATTTPANLLNSKKPEEIKHEKTENNEKNHNFQVPPPPKNTKNSKPIKKIESNLKHVSTTTTLANSQAANQGRNDSPDDEESSNDVLIVSEKTPSSTEFVLTEESLAEHNKLFGSYSTGNGTFSSHTKEYINKWVSELINPDDKPFPEEVIPIDSFGTKILNDPQYLNVKSRQQQHQPTSVKATKPVTTQVIKTGKESPQNVKPTSTSPKPQKNETEKSAPKQNDMVIKSDQQTTVNPPQQARLPAQFPFQLPFDQTTPSQAWSYAPQMTIPRPNSPTLRPEHLTWTNIQNGSESVNQLIAAAVGCSLATNTMHLLNPAQNLAKSIPMPPHQFSNPLNPKFTPKPSLVIPQNIDPTKANISYLPNHDYFNSLNQDPSYMIPSYAKLKLKSEKLIDIRTQQQAAAAAAAAVAASNSIMHQMPPMINVENVNFYGALDEKQKAAAACFFQQQDPCLNCMPNTAQNISNQATTAAAAAAAAVAMNIAKILANQPETKIESKTEPKLEPRTEQKSDIKTSHESKKNFETESVVSLSSNSSDVKLIKTETKEKNNEESNENFVKKEPLVQEESVKKEPSIKEDNIYDEEDNKSVSSSLSSSVHLVVDETSMIVNENLESQMNVESQESQINEKTDSNSNTNSNNMNVDSIAVNPMETNSNLMDSENTEEKQVEKQEKTWMLNSEPLEANIYSSIKNRVSNLIVNLNDYVVIEKINKKETISVSENVYNELINESSNTNYSCDENDCSNGKTVESVAQIKSIRVDPTCDKIMVSVKMFYKPDHIRNEIKNLTESIKFEENELISSQDTCEQDLVEAEVIKSKSILSDHTNYLKMKENEKEHKEDVNEKVYFYRYDYDLSKKEINLIVEK